MNALSEHHTKMAELHRHHANTLRALAEGTMSPSITANFNNQACEAERVAAEHERLAEQCKSKP